jgi:hypothetical protein
LSVRTSAAIGKAYSAASSWLSASAWPVFPPLPPGEGRGEGNLRQARVAPTGAGGPDSSAIGVPQGTRGPAWGHAGSKCVRSPRNSSAGFPFFSPHAGLWPPPCRSRRPSSSTHLSCGQPLRSGRRLDECRNRREKRPADKGRDMSFRRTLSGTMSKTHDTIWTVAPKRAQFQEHCLLSSDTFLNNVLFPGRFPPQCPISGRFLRQCPSCTTRSDAMSRQKPRFQPFCFKP